jgi:NitT/TauT family transport system ATP-binding protein
LTDPVLELRDVCMAFAKPSGEPLPVLEHVNVALRDGEILGLLGRSGSGKSTLLRITAGLIRPTSGSAIYRGVPLSGPADGIGMVFQTFALFPWLTVLENVEASLDPLGVPAAQARTRALAAIDQIGLSGFEGAYPRELSGGMRQRVGFARAMVIQPAVLLMDEPFSALDVLTAEKLRTDFIDLWTARDLPIRSVLIVTHNIEEAVSICDRIFVLSTGRLAAEIPVRLEHPRDRHDDAFRAIVDDIYEVLTAHVADVLASNGRIHRMPDASVYAIGELVDTLAAHDGRADASKLAHAISAHGGSFLAAAEALNLLTFAEMKDGDIVLTASGHAFARADDDERQRLFKEHLVRFVPFAAHIDDVLTERSTHEAPRARFEYELQDHLTKADAQETLRIIIAWARYAQLFTYDDRRRVFAKR